MEFLNLKTLRMARHAMILAGALTLGAPLVIARSAHAFAADERDSSPGGPRWERLADRLALTPDQQQKILAIREDTQARNRAISKEIRRLENELEGALLEESIDESKVLGLVGQIGDARTEQRQNRMRMRLDVAEKLTPEQRDQWLLIKEKSLRDGRRGGEPRRGYGRGHGEGRGPHGRAGTGCDRECPHGRGGAKCDGEGPHGRADRK